jgi:hypothetical protein
MNPSSSVAIKASAQLRSFENEGEQAGTHSRTPNDGSGIHAALKEQPRALQQQAIAEQLATDCCG